MQIPRVTVIIIFLNAAPFIEEAINSVLTQTYRDWELLLVDDGSYDGSTALAQSAVARHPQHIHYLHHADHQNRGMSASRNLGVKHARGEYVAFLDADDAWYPCALQEQVAILDAHQQAALVYGPIEWWYGWADQGADRRRDFVEKLGVPANTLIPPPRLLPLFLQDKAAVPSGLLVRREMIDRVGGFDEVFRGEYEDQVFCAKVCVQAPVFAARQCWYRYRQHANSCVSIGQQTGQTDAARLTFLHWLQGYLIEQRVHDRQVWQALRHELLPYRHPTLYRLRQYARLRMQQVNGLLKLRMSA